MVSRCPWQVGRPPFPSAHRFKFTEAQSRARAEVFEGSGGRILSFVKRISLAEKHSVPLSYIVPALGDLVRRPGPLDETEVVRLSGEMVARIGVSRERYTRESSTMFASETWLKRVTHDIVRSIRYSEESSTGACGAKIV